MTGRRLYELWCDSLAETGDWDRRQDGFQLPTGPVRAWAFLTHGEQRVWTRAAARLPKRRASR